jgi:hypothetical protein
VSTVTVGTRDTWSTTARGTRTVPVLLIAGLDAVFVPEGLSVASVSLSGTVDSLWWPSGSLSNVKPWISLTHGLSWSERARPADAQALEIGAIEVLLSDVGSAATALFSQRDSLVGTPLTAEVTATDTTVHVVDTSAFASSGVVYLGREAIAYASKTSTTFAGCTRARFGSFAQKHPYAAIGGAIGTEVPEATDGPADVVGRVATLWLCTVSSAGVITAAELEFVGHVGIDAALASDGDAWVLRIDHAVHKVGQPVRAPTVTVGGWSHVGNRGIRGSTTRTPGNSVWPLFGTCPLYLLASDAGYSPVYQVLLSDEASDPDSGGWHPTRESFLDAINRASDAVTGSDQFHVSLLPDERLRVVWRGSPPRIIAVRHPWDPTRQDTGFTAYGQITIDSSVPMPTAWVLIDRASRVYLTAGDYAAVPSVPSNPIAGVSSHVEIYYVLAIGGDSATFPRYARITDTTASGGVYYLTCTALDSQDAPVSPLPPGAPAYAQHLSGVLAFVVTMPTPARVAMWIACDDWIDGLEALTLALDADAGDGLSQAFDWDDMRRVLARFRPVFSASRRFVFDGDQTPLSWLINECVLGGFALTIRRGRITLVRVAEYAITEATDGTVVSADLSRAESTPGFSRGSEPIINRFSATWPGSKYTVNVYDATSLSLYGHQKTAFEAQIPFGAIPPTWSAGAVYNAIFALGMTTLGPHRRPAETIEATAPLHLFGLQLGDVVDLSMWRVPNQSRGRGVTDVAAQVVAREPSLFGEDEGRVKLTLRASPSQLAGWTPSIFVAAGGITGAVVTADMTTFGSSGCAPLGESPTYGFAAGDKVRLVEIDSASPATAERRTIASVTSTTITLTSAPSGAFAALAASALKVLLIPDDYDTTGLQTTQKRYAYLADRTTYTLAAGVRGRRFAA